MHLFQIIMKHAELGNIIVVTVRLRFSVAIETLAVILKPV